MGETTKQSKRGPRPPSPPASRLRRLIAENVQALLDHHYPLSKYRIKSKQQRQLAQDAGVSWSSVQRMLDPDDGKAIDTLADVAVALDIPPFELLRARATERIPTAEGIPRPGSLRRRQG